VSYFTFVHPFLKSDNRHYTFYIWKDFLAKYSIMMIPIYGLAGEYVAAYFPSRTRYAVWIMCSALALIPAGLLEPRYFITPVIIAAMELKVEVSWVRGFAIFAFNIILLWILATAPYKGIHFMW
jgi:alpha-1,2-glucosyltransferase